MKSRLISRLRDWLDDRTGARQLGHSFLQLPLPERVGWAHSFGFAAMTVFLLVGATGVFLAFNYAASPDHALASIAYINSLPGGAIVRGLHVFGGGALFVLVGLHLLRVFVQGAYKRPREVTWMLGIVLLLLVIGFLFTGDPLPWDQKAYWTVRVRAGYAEGLPLIGPYVRRLMLGGETQGAPTLARFFIIHVFVLPALFAPLVAAHIALARRKGTMPPGVEADDEAAAPRVRVYFPEQAFKDVVVASAVIAACYALATKVGVHTEGPPDASAQDYVPRPEWYFLPLFKLVKLQVGGEHIFAGTRTWLATALIPNLVIAVLLLLPFLDRNPARNPRKRPFALSLMSLFLVVTAVLGLKGRAETDAEVARLQRLQPGTRSRLTGLARLGEAMFRKKCTTCHRVGDAGKRKMGPDLRQLADGAPEQWRRDDLIFFLINPKLTYPDTVMPPAAKLHLSLDDLDAMAEYCALFQFDRQRAGPAKAITNAPPPNVATAAGAPTGVGQVMAAFSKSPSDGPGFAVFQKECLKCHKLNGVGGKAAIRGIPGMPEFISGRSQRTRDWMVKLLKNPASVFKDTVMPAAEVRGNSFEALVDFMMSVKVGKFVASSSASGAGLIPVPAIPGAALQKRIDQLAKENAALKAQIEQLKLAAAPPLPELPPLEPDLLMSAVTTWNARCRRCHVAEGIEGISGGGALGLKFAKGRSPRTKDELLKIIEDPRATLGADTIMPPTKIVDEKERDALLELCLRLKPLPK